MHIKGGVMDSIVAAEKANSSLEIYGGIAGNEYFTCQSEKAIDRAIASIESGVGKQTSGVEIFFNVFTMLRKTRNAIAVHTKTENAEHFGRLRNPEITPKDHLYLPVPTLLVNSASKKSIRQLAKRMRPMKHTLTTFDQTEIKYKEKCLGRTVTFTAKVYTSEMLKKIITPNLIVNAQAALETKKSQLQIYKDRTLFSKLKAEHPDLYNACILHNILGIMGNAYPSPVINEAGECLGNKDNLKCLFPICTIRVEINGKLYAIGKHLTWMYQTYKTDPIDRMVECSKATVIHQDVFLINDTLQAIAKIFSEAILWDKQTQALEELKDKVALFRYIYAYCMPCFRGDGAIGDWFELSIYRFHGFTGTRYRLKASACYEPLTSTSLSLYRKRYDKTIIIE